MEANYNDVGTWRYVDLLPTLGAAPGSYKTYQVKTRSDVEKLLADEDFATAEKLRVSFHVSSLFFFDE